MRLTLADARNSRIPKFLGMCSTDAAFLSILNEAHGRLVRAGNYWGTFQTYAICLSTEGCLTWPRQIASIEAIALKKLRLPLPNNSLQAFVEG